MPNKNTLNNIVEQSIDTKEVIQEEALMQLNEIVALFDGHKEQELFSKIQGALEHRLRSISSTAYEDRGIAYYYLIRNLLSKNILLSEDAISKYYYKLLKNFTAYEEQLMSAVGKIKNRDGLSALKLMQAKAFLKINGRYFLLLEQEFEKKNFPELRSNAFQKRMYYRKQLFWLKKKYFSWLSYELWDRTSQYGENFLRWGYTSLAFVFILACIYFVVGTFESVPYDAAGNLLLSSPIPTDQIAGYTNHPMLHKIDGEFFDYIYFVTVTFTTLGYGDITPLTHLEKAITLAAVCMGYTMLGVFMTILSKRF